MAEKNVSITLPSPVEGLRARADVDTTSASAALSAISILHSPVTEGEATLCKTCSSIADEPGDHVWPCETAEAILGAIDTDMLDQLGWINLD